jgi:predicted dienelactone hydrolase
MIKKWMGKSKVFYHLLGLFAITAILVSCSAIPAIQPQPTSTLVIKPIILPVPQIYSGMPEYSNPGPYTVGMVSLRIPNNDNELEVYVFYPVQKDGKPDAKGGPFPLVVYASGWAMPPLEGYQYLLEHLASYGFVTTIWSPRDEDAFNPSNNLWFAPIGYRPLDLKLLLGYLEITTARGGPLDGLIDMKRIAIGGHSMGGGTALETSGAQIDFGWCSAHKDLVSKDTENTCYQYVNYQKDIAEIRGLKTIPEGKWPEMSDPRIVAVVAMAPVGKLWGAEYEGVATVKVPALIMTGDQDTDLRPEIAAYPVYEHLGSRQKSLVVFEQKDHLLFWGPGYSTGSTEDLDRIKHIMTAFLLTEVKGDPEAAKALSPENMVFPGVKYETTEFNK